MPMFASPPRAVVVFDIDGVIRDVSASYRRAIIETVHHFHGQRPEPAAIDGLKSEGSWNNDWQASLELLRRGGLQPLPAMAAVPVDRTPPERSACTPPLRLMLRLIHQSITRADRPTKATTAANMFW